MAPSATEPAVRWRASVSASCSSMVSPSAQIVPRPPPTAASTRCPDHAGSTRASAMWRGRVDPNSCGRSGRARSWTSVPIIVGHRSGTCRAYHPAVASAAPSTGQASRARGLAGLTPSGRAIVPAAWSLYDFANTIFSFAVVSGAIGLYLNDQFGPRDGAVLLGVSVALSVGLNALVSPILGAISDRGGRRMPFLLLFTALCIGSTFFITDVPASI